MRVALVHEWLTSYAGSERVFEQMLAMWPGADVYCVVDKLAESDRGFLGGRRPRTTFVQHLPGVTKNYRRYLPLMPFAIGRLDLSAYDLIISSNHAVAKGVRKRVGQVHVCYIHTPMRYAWDLREQYLKETGLDRGIKGKLARVVLEWLRQWDERTAASVDVFVANSHYIAERVRRCYGRESEVVYPPVNVNQFALRRDKENFYLTASRLVPYKKVPLIAEAFASMPDRKLIVIGDGPEADRLRKVISNAPNIEWLGYQEDAVLIDHMRRARGFVFAAEEDFGITPVEAQACGTPVIAFGRGGVLETVRPPDARAEGTGIFFEEQTAASLRSALDRFENCRERCPPEACRDQALHFTPEQFRLRFKTVIDQVLARRQVGS